MIDMSHITKTFELESGEIISVLKDINLNISQGQWVSLVGASGSGKTTLLNILGCLDSPDHGDYRFNAERLNIQCDSSMARFRREHLGFVFQGFYLMNDFTLIDNVAMPLYYKGIPVDERELLAREMLKKVGLSHRVSYYPYLLSGGERQRVAIARALINNPDLILADEPTGNLDQQTTEDIMSVFRDISEDGVTIVMVTHDKDVANQASRVISLHDGVIQDDRGDQYAS